MKRRAWTGAAPRLSACLGSRPQGGGWGGKEEGVLRGLLFKPHVLHARPPLPTILTLWSLASEKKEKGQVPGPAPSREGEAAGTHVGMEVGGGWWSLEVVMVGAARSG